MLALAATSATTTLAAAGDVDRDVNATTDQIVFEVREERPERFWREGPWQEPRTLD